jgi:Transglutaminase-like superfamily.
MKKKMIIISSIILVLSVAGVLIYMNYAKKMKKEKELITEIKETNKKATLSPKLTFEYGDELKKEDLAKLLVKDKKLYKDTTIELLQDKKKFKNMKLDKVKKFKVTLNLIHEKVTTSKEYTIVVEDTKFPVFEGLANKTIEYGEHIELKGGIKAYDPVDGDLEFTVENIVEIHIAGDYKLIVKAKDKNGNETVGEYTVTVKPQPVVATGGGTTGSKKATGGSTGGSSGGGYTAAPSAKSQRESQARAAAKVVAGQIFNGGMSQEAKAQAIATYLYRNVAQQTNQSTEAYKTNFGNEAYAALVMKIAACSGVSKAALMLCAEAGLQCQHINANGWTHQWNTALINGQWRAFDGQLGMLFPTSAHPYV